MNKTAMQAIAIIMVMAMAATSLVAVMSSDVSAEEQSYDVDMGKKYSMQTQLIWDGKDAESIHYEIVDAAGNPITSSDEWNPLITWPAPGVYYITQTAHNSYNGGSDTTTVYRVEIMGYPEIHFETNGGSEVQDIEQTAFNAVAAQPADPVRDGYDFTGWYTDEDCTQAFDWSQGLKADITLYAGWEANGNTPVDPEPTPEDPKDEDGFQIELWMIILIIIVIIVVAAIIYLARR